MTRKQVFLSHASKDDAFVKALRQALEIHGVNAWADSRELLPGDVLQTEIEQAISAADVFFLVFSKNTLQSKWVKKELEFAKSLQKRIVTLLLDEQTVGALAWLFDDEPVAIAVSTAPGELQNAMPEILAALGLQLPADADPAAEAPESKFNELTLVLESPRLFTEGGLRRGRAMGHFEMKPADGGETVTTETFDFICPLGPIEAGRLREYVEDYPRAVFLDLARDRGEELERELTGWGKQMFDALTNPPDAREVFWEWKGDNVHERRFSVLFRFFNEKNLPAESREAISLLMATPWEILHDGGGFLFQGKKPVRVRRRMPNRGKKENIELQNCLRILLLSPRPVDDSATYIDHRVAPAALLEAVEPLGALAELTLLETPTFEAMCQAIEAADREGRPFSVVHFDGHGVFDPHRGLGALCFESNEPGEQQKLENRKTHIVHTDEIGAALRGYRIPFFFLDACQSAVTKENPTGSVAATLLETGVASVAAMSYSVLVATAGQFARAFYHELAAGARIGSAMLAGQKALHADPLRAELPGGKQLKMQDWFVPVLFQEEKDPPLVKKIPGAAVRRNLKAAREAERGEVPEAPTHGFVGRDRELLALERLLHAEPWAVLVGAGGAGKTTLAIELARWMHRTRRVRRLAFVSFEKDNHPKSALAAIGRQLVGADFSATAAVDEEKAMQLIERQLHEFETLIVLDNLESILPAPGSGEVPAGAEPFEHFSRLFLRLKKAGASLVFTSRERLPAPFDAPKNHRPLGALSKADALRLIAGVRRDARLEEPRRNLEDLEQDYGTLAERLNFHARACALLAKIIPPGSAALNQMDAEIVHLMAELELKNPGERENSLFASLELSLRRLPDELRAVVDALAVFHGGADLVAWAKVAQQEPNVVAKAGMALVQVGLAEVALAEPPFFFKTDPALPAWLAAHTPPDALAARRQRWLEGMTALSGFLYQQQNRNLQLAYDLARLTEANLVAMLAELEKQATPEQLVNEAGKVEALFSKLSRPQVMAFAQNIREKGGSRLKVGMGAWSRAQFENKRSSIDRFLEQGNLQVAYQLAKELQSKSEQAGSQVYPGADYDIAGANFMLGRVLSMAGQPEQALPFLQTARQRFLALAAGGNAGAERMASVCLTEAGDCLRDLGRYEEAAGQYEMAIELDEKRGDLRDVATGKGQLATVRMQQKNYPEALRLYGEVKTFFERNHEPDSVATAWHQIGIVHQEAENYPAAEKAYQESLAIKMREKNKAGEASSLTQLGNLYNLMGWLEDAVRMYEGAILIDLEFKNLRDEGIDRNNLAQALLKLRRPAEARTQLLRAIECKSQFGHAAEPWKTWGILCNLETAEGNTAAAAEARQKAMQAYAAYRSDGGESQSNTFQLIVAAAQAMQAEQVGEVIPQFENLMQQNVPAFVKALIRALLALLRGDRRPALADDPELYYMDAVDLRLVFFGE